MKALSGKFPIFSFSRLERGHRFVAEEADGMEGLKSGKPMEESGKEATTEEEKKGKGEEETEGTAQHN